MSAPRRFINFDEMWAERKMQPLVVQLLDKEYELPAARPAGMRLLVGRIIADRGGDATMTLGDIRDLARCLLGEAAFEELCFRQITEVQLAEFVNHVSAEYDRFESVGRPEPDASSGEAPAPVEGA